MAGKFWPWVRELIYAKAEELHASDFHRGHTENITPPTKQELREGGYFHQAKIIILRELHRSGGDRT